MKLFNFLKPQKKNYQSLSDGVYFIEGNQGFIFFSQEQKFIDFYTQAAPVFTATKLIADACCGIEIEIKDELKEAYLENHPFLDLLENPNPFIDEDLFIKECISYYQLTGNCYIKIITANKKPVELQVINPANVIIRPYNDGWAGEYTITNGFGLNNEIFKRNGYEYDNIRTISEKNLIKNRFFSQLGNEIIHLRDFNPKFSSNNLVGSSAFLGCQLEIAQYLMASQHNYSYLKNKAMPSGILVYKGQAQLSTDALTKIRTDIIDKLMGYNNNGKPVVINQDFQWIPLSESIKDMDFKSLKEDVVRTVFNAVKIPLPMISSGAMSYSNMDASKYMFYDNAVLPVFKKFLEFLEHKILKTYYAKDNQDLSLEYDEASIEALEARKVDNTLKLKQIGVLTMDELRENISYDKLQTGGDIVYQPTNLLPIGNPVQEQEKQQYIKLMSSALDSEGKRLYSDELIKKNLNILYG